MKRAVVLIACAALLGGCASGAAGDEPIESSAEAGVSSSSEEPVEPEELEDPEGAEGSEEATDAVDALSITGPRYAAQVPDMQAVVEETPAPALPATVTDASGIEVGVESAERILTFDLYGTLTDTVIGLGLSDRLVGRSISDTQEDLEDLPVVTYGSHDLNIEAVLDLDPDLILTNGTIGTEEIYGQLEGAGVNVVRFEHVPALEAIGDTITLVGQTLGLEEEARELADATRADLDDALETIEQLRAATPRDPRGAVLYVRGTAGVFFILGEDYGAADILRAVGLDDVAANEGITNLKPANAEALVSLDPEIILAMDHGVESTGGIDGFLARPGLSATTAGASERLVIAGDNQLLSYGPRTPANLVALAEAIYSAAG